MRRLWLICVIPFLLIISCTIQRSPTAIQFDSVSPFTSTPAIEEVHTSIPTTEPTQIIQIATSPPWRVRSALSTLPQSRLFYETMSRIYAIDIDCENNSGHCLSEPYLSSPSEGDRGGMKVSPDGQLIAIARVDAYGASGLQASIRLISVPENRMWAIGLMGTRYPVWSPDSKYIAYIDYLVSGGEFSRICFSTPFEPLMCLPHSQSGARIISIVWSPDGRYIAYCENLDMYYPKELYIVDMDSYNTVHIASEVSNPVWSPDGEILFFTKYYQDGVDQLIAASIVDCTVEFGPCWRETELVIPTRYFEFSPDGNLVSFQSREGLGVINTECFLDPNQCTSQPHYLTDPSFSITDYSWAPDSRHIAYSVASESFGGIYIVNIESGETIFVERLEPNYYPRINWRVQ